MFQYTSFRSIETLIRSCTSTRTTWDLAESSRFGHTREALCKRCNARHNPRRLATFSYAQAHGREATCRISNVHKPNQAHLHLKMTQLQTSLISVNWTWSWIARSKEANVYPIKKIDGNWYIIYVFAGETKQRWNCRDSKKAEDW